MPKTITKSAVQKDMKRAEALMRIYTQSLENQKNLMASIKNELDSYKENMKAAEKELIEIGERNKDQFNVDDNLVFEDGYLHIAHNTVVVTTKKFDIATFNTMYPEFVEIGLKKGPIRKAFTDKDMRKELTTLGVQLDTEKVMQVIPITAKK
jgi:hypothetical protein